MCFFFLDFIHLQVLDFIVKNLLQIGALAQFCVKQFIVRARVNKELFSSSLRIHERV